MIRIWAKYIRGVTEEIDTAPDEKTARYLVAEYQLAYGPDFVVWSGRKSDEPRSSTTEYGAAHG
jgi:hypothetical protein